MAAGSVPAAACSRVFWNTDAKIVGRNMDWPEDTAAKLWFFPAGMTRGGLSGDKNPLKEWTSLYASVAVSFFDKGTTDGMNEAGLVVNGLWLSESDYGKRNLTVPGLSLSVWIQYLLDNYKTVQQVVDASQTIKGQQPKFQLVPYVLNGLDVKAHISVADKTGDTAIIEYIGGSANIYHGKDYTVMTNSPPLPEQIKNLKAYEYFSKQKPLPGSSESKDRFVRGVFCAKRMPAAAGLNANVAAMASVMHYVAQPMTKKESPEAYNSQTRWTTIANPESGTFFFKLTRNPFLVWVKLHELAKPDAGVAMFDVTAHAEKAGDITEELRADQGHSLTFARGNPDTKKLGK